MTYLTRTLVNDFHRQLTHVLKAEDVLDKVFLGHICTAMMLNEFELVIWCFSLYTILNQYQMIEDLVKDDGYKENLIKFASSEELVISCAIFAKFVANSLEENQAQLIIRDLQLNGKLLVDMFEQIRFIIDDPISIEAFYSEMRMCNDPKTGQHAEDYNQMVNQMVLDSKPRTGPIGGGMQVGTGISPSFDTMYKNTYGIQQQPQAPQHNVFNPSQPAEQLATIIKRESEP